jgi:hypothetical protein
MKIKRKVLKKLLFINVYIRQRFFNSLKNLIIGYFGEVNELIASTFGKTESENYII